MPYVNGRYIEFITRFDPAIDLRSTNFKDKIAGAKILAETRIMGCLYKLYDNDIYTVNEGSTDVRHNQIAGWYCASQNTLMYYRVKYNDDHEINGGEWLPWEGGSGDDPNIWQTEMDDLLFQLAVNELLIEE